MGLTDNELSLAITQIIDKKTKPIELMLENEVIPRLQNLESCYTSTYKRCSIELDNIE